MPVWPGLPETHQSADRGGCGVEDGNVIFFNHLPPSVWIWECGSPFIKERSSAIKQRTVHQVGMTCNPTRICCTPPPVFILNIKYISERSIDANHIAAMCMKDRLGFSGCT